MIPKPRITLVENIKALPEHFWEPKTPFSESNTQVLVWLLAAMPQPKPWENIESWHPSESNSRDKWHLSHVCLVSIPGLRDFTSFLQQPHDEAISWIGLAPLHQVSFEAFTALQHRGPHEVMILVATPETLFSRFGDFGPCAGVFRGLQDRGSHEVMILVAAPKTLFSLFFGGF